MKIVILILCSFLANHVFGIKLNSYNVDKSKITVSGISSGAAMANQLHVAFSDTINGVGIVSAPPYYCSSGYITTSITCMNGLLGAFGVSMTSIYRTISNYLSKGLVDDTNNFKNDKVYIYHGIYDIVVVSYMVKKNEEFYQNYITNSNQIKTVYSYGSNHGFITNNYGSLCAILNTGSYLNDCNYNQAYDILNHMYGPGLAAPSTNDKAEQGIFEVDQTEFFPSGTSSYLSMDSSAYLYVPKNCLNGKVCKLHIALHGCAQGKYKIGSEFAVHAGFNEVADLNDIIILYPQVKSLTLSNPNGCWDWWGYTNSNFANKLGPQMIAIKSMIDRITGN